LRAISPSRHRSSRRRAPKPRAVLADLGEPARKVERRLRGDVALELGEQADALDVLERSDRGEADAAVERRGGEDLAQDDGVIGFARVARAHVAHGEDGEGCVGLNERRRRLGERAVERRRVGGDER